MVKCLPEFECFTVFLKNIKKNISNIRRSKVTDYAALISLITMSQYNLEPKCTVHCRVPYSNYDLSDRNWKYGTLQCLSESDTESISYDSCAQIYLTVHSNLFSKHIELQGVSKCQAKQSLQNK